MPIQTEIALERRGPKSIKPKDDERTKNGRTLVTTNSAVLFIRAPDVFGGDITFVERSPFGPLVVGYGTALVVSAAFDESNPAANVYRYRCRGKTADGIDLDSEDGGGEMVVGRP